MFGNNPNQAPGQGLFGGNTGGPSVFGQPGNAQPGFQMGASQASGQGKLGDTQSLFGGKGKSVSKGPSVGGSLFDGINNRWSYIYYENLNTLINITYMKK